MSTFFRNVDRRTGRDVCNTREIQALKARAILIDMEEGPVSETLNGPLGALFDQQQTITDVSGAGNNWYVQGLTLRYIYTTNVGPVDTVYMDHNITNCY